MGAIWIVLATLLAPLPLIELHVTQGAIEERGGVLHVEAPQVRAVARRRADDVELRFRDLGPTGKRVPLASGAQRRQVGLKLRAADSCNVLYVMWRLEPEERLVVSLKVNPGSTTHAACGNRGYRDLAPAGSAPLPRAARGSWRSLRATIGEGELVVLADGLEVWRGHLPAEALALDGPPGLRSDDTRLELQLLLPLAR